MTFQKIFIDTSAWIAYSSAADQNHKKIEKSFAQAVSGNVVFFTSNDVVDETITRLVYDIGWYQAEKFIVAIRESFRTKTIVQLWTDEQIQDEAFVILEKFHDHKLSMTDATTVAIINRFKLDAVLTLDSDFKKIGIRSLP